MVYSSWSVKEKYTRSTKKFWLIAPNDAKDLQVNVQGRIILRADTEQWPPNFPLILNITCYFWLFKFKWPQKGSPSPHFPTNLIISYDSKKGIILIFKKKKLIYFFIYKNCLYIYSLTPQRNFVRKIIEIHSHFCIFLHLII